MSILVSGGAGYIGSHTCVELIQAGCEIIVADNLCNSSEEALRRVEKITGKSVPFVRTELCNEAEVEAPFSSHPGVDAVIHFAGYKAVGESVEQPLKYYENNVGITVALLKVMGQCGVKNIVFSSSATVYGMYNAVPFREDMPTSATNPYGQTKVMIEQMLRDLFAADAGWGISILRYFNPLGAHESGLIGEDPNGIPNNLVPYIAQVAVGKLEKLHVYGDDYPTPDGTGVRDYIHVTDLARGHVAALKKLDTGCGLFTCNLGTGNGYSVLDVLHAYEKACGHELPYVIEARRPGDIAACYADPARARDELGWTAQLGIEEMCASSWKWQSMNPNGYKGGTEQ